MYSGHSETGSYDKNVYSVIINVPLQPTAPPIAAGTAKKLT